MPFLSLHYETWKQTHTSVSCAIAWLGNRKPAASQSTSISRKANRGTGGYGFNPEQPAIRKDRPNKRPNAEDDLLYDNQWGCIPLGVSSPISSRRDSRRIWSPWTKVEGSIRPRTGETYFWPQCPFSSPSERARSIESHNSQRLSFNDTQYNETVIVILKWFVAIFSSVRKVVCIKYLWYTIIRSYNYNTVSLRKK